MTWKPLLRGFVGLAALAIPAFAHHIFYEEFDGNKPITLTGKVQSVKWSEPHTTFTLSVASGKSKGEWTLEAAGAEAFTKKLNFNRENLKVGDTITVQAYQATNGSLTASARSIDTHGTRYAVCDPQEDGGPNPVGATNPTALHSSSSQGVD